MLDILKNMQKELSVFLISILLASIVIVISHSWWQTSYDDKNLAEMDLNAAKARYYTAINQKKLLEQFEDNYNKLTTIGIVGEEDRLNWVDTIENITANNKIPYLKYKIEQREPVKSSQLSKKFPGLELYKSSMSLEMQLLHEGDLYTIINKLHQKAKGLFDINSCAIIRNSTSVESLVDSQTNRNFSAKCQLNWYTMQKKSVKLPRRRNI